VPERLDRVQAGGPPGRVDTEDEAHRGGKADGEDEGVHLEQRGPRGHAGDAVGPPPPASTAPQNRLCCIGSLSLCDSNARTEGKRFRDHHVQTVRLRVWRWSRHLEIFASVLRGKKPGKGLGFPGTIAHSRFLRNAAYSASVREMLSRINSDPLQQEGICGAVEA
jgi:hypothetical protein